MIITAERLILRPYKSSDINDLVEGLNDFETAKNLTVPYPYTKKNAIEFLSHTSENNKNLHFAIQLKNNDKLIGGTSIEFIDDKIKGGIWINKDYRGIGYGIEVMTARARYIFDNFKVDKIENGFFDFNKKSWKMQQKIGYEIIGEKTNFCPALNSKVREIVTMLSRENFYKSTN